MRYAELRPCLNAFIDSRTPGSDAKENFTIIGPGVSENPAQFVHITEPHGFNIGGARQPPNCVNSQHSHLTAEVFVAHTGQWRFDFGEHGEDASVLAGPGDLVSFPTGLFRGFTNVGAAPGFLWSVLGGDNPGRVMWAPQVFDMARDYGLVLLENGVLIDTGLGESPPADVALMPRTSAQDVARMRRITPGEAERLLVRDDARPGERLAIGPGAPLDWPHGFTVSRVNLLAGEATPKASPDLREVIFVHAGRVEVSVSGETLTAGPGDTVTIPPGAARAYAALDDASIFVVRGAG